MNKFSLRRVRFNTENFPRVVKLVRAQWFGQLCGIYDMPRLVSVTVSRNI